MYKLFLVFLYAACNKKNILHLVCFRQTIESLVDPKLFIFISVFNVFDALMRSWFAFSATLFSVFYNTVNQNF